MGRWEHEGWAALLLTRVPGRTARQVWPSLDDGQKGRILQRLGETLATLHTLPVPPVLRSWERSVRHGPVAAAWVAKHAPPPGTPRFLHGDLTDENVLLVGDQVGGILDFGGSWAGDPPLDVITPGLFLAGGRPALLGALLDGMGQRRAPEELLAWHLLHPFSSVPRDFAMGGLPPDAPVEAGVALWRTT